mgnify:CR=1 FL=1
MKYRLEEYYRINMDTSKNESIDLFKECVNCDMVKQLSAFSKDDEENDGVRNKCILCEELYKQKMESIDTAYVSDY